MKELPFQPGDWRLEKEIQLQKTIIHAVSHLSFAICQLNHGQVFRLLVLEDVVMYPSVIFKEEPFFDICLSQRSLRCWCQDLMPSTLKLGKIKDAISLPPFLIGAFQHSRLSPRCRQAGDTESMQGKETHPQTDSAAAASKTVNHYCRILSHLRPHLISHLLPLGIVPIEWELFL